MKRLLIAAAVAALVPLGAQAQTADELAKGAGNTKAVVNYGMGYNLQRHSALTQINKETVRKTSTPLRHSWTSPSMGERSRPSPRSRSRTSFTSSIV